MGDRFVIDTSVVMTWCFIDQANQYADAVLEHLAAATAVVPTIWPREVVNGLLVAERRNRLRPVDSARFLALISRLPIHVEPAWPDASMMDLLALVRPSDLSSYDAAYLDLTIRQGLPIATLDRKLAEAARGMDVPMLTI